MDGCMYMYVCPHLHTSDGASLRSRDALLHGAHVRRQSGLVAHSGRYTPKSSLSEPEDVVNKQQHVLPLLVSKVLCQGQPCERDARPRAGRLVHLTVYQRYLRYELFTTTF
ncbi:unnamed protein product, partial [Brenthis ino]